MPPPRRKPNAASWLIGTWRSDRRKTLAGWIWPPGAKGARFRKIIEPSFGKLTFRYTRARMYWRFDAPAFEWTPYRIVWSNADTVFFVTSDDSMEVGYLLHFTSRNEYWVHAGKGIEFFRRQQDT